MNRALLVALLAVPLAACDGEAPPAVLTATAPVSALGTSAPDVAGTVTFTQDGPVLSIAVALTGVPEGDHGFHVHGRGACGADLGGHYDPDRTGNHGGPNDRVETRHAGDLGNVTADADGRVQTTMTTGVLSLDGSRQVQGRAVVLRERRDDLATDPVGGSGDPIGCGSISAATASDG